MDFLGLTEIVGLYFLAICFWLIITGIVGLALYGLYKSVQRLFKGGKNEG